MLFIKVPRKDGEKVRKQLITAGVLDKKYDVISSGTIILFPVSKKWGDFETVELAVIRRPDRFEKLEDALSKFLTKSELEHLITSFDIIGDIAIVEIPTSLEQKEVQIGSALLTVHRNLKTVLKKLGPMEGEYRVRPLKCISGEDKTETYYKESGVTMKLDLSKVYFSVRLATERKRIAELVKDGEKILVLFAGVGPFALIIAKNRPSVNIVAVEINPEAVRYMHDNVSLNRLANIEIIETDARQFKMTGFDRVIMPLPKSAHEFLDIAFNSVKSGGVVHFYTLADIKRPFDDALEKAQIEAKKSNVNINLISSRIVRPYSPATVQVVLDLSVSKQ